LNSNGKLRVPGLNRRDAIMISRVIIADESEEGKTNDKKGLELGKGA
jgi:hypothetical protein